MCGLNIPGIKKLLYLHFVLVVKAPNHVGVAKRPNHNNFEKQQITDEKQVNAAFYLLAMAILSATAVRDKNSHLK